jgi:hypothetical protein
MRADKHFVRVNADLLVGRPGMGKRNYAAAMQYPAEWRFGSGDADQSMFVRGFVLDTIEKKTRIPAVGESIFPEWAKFGGWADMTANPPDRFWRTLIADRGPNGLNPPPYYQRACKYAFSKIVIGGPLETGPDSR